MSSDVTLYSSRRSGRPGDGGKRVMGAAYRMPVFWMASVALEHLRRLPWEDAEEDEEDAADVFFELRATEALALFEQRREVLRKLMPHVEDWAPDWVAFLKRQGSHFLLFDIGEFLAMGDEVEDQILEGVRLFETPTPARQSALFAAAGLTEEQRLSKRGVTGPGATRNSGPEDASVLGAPYPD